MYWPALQYGACINKREVELKQMECADVQQWLKTSRPHVQHPLSSSIRSTSPSGQPGWAQCLSLSLTRYIWPHEGAAVLAVQDD